MNLPHRSPITTTRPARDAAPRGGCHEVLMAAVEGAGRIRWMVLARAAVRGIGGEPVFIVDSEHETVDAARAAVQLARWQQDMAPQQA